ncbi:MAG: hypothetical protein MSC43_00495 [Clostridiales bacterium]|nr:hypothetical protein [Clostridiales bacterium]MDD7433134.1 hypothetical protein [Clostridiales bacterium]MDY3062011.1 hypothetical protein [Eubacteriales bacterium]
MLDIEYVMMNPAQNLTGLVITPVPKEQHLNISNFLLQPAYIGAEQIGFVSFLKQNAIVRLDMPNNEFCGDGTLATAVLASWMNVVDTSQFLVEVSGVEEPLLASVEPISSHEFYAKVEMPRHFRQRSYELPLGEECFSGTLIELPGISHFIIHSDDVNGSKEMIISLVKQLSVQHKAPAYGVITYEVHENNIQMIPCIYIPKSGKLMFESACGSGTMALGIFLSSINVSRVQTDIVQPGGILDVDVIPSDSSTENNFAIERLSLGGRVKISSKGHAYLAEC